MSCAILRATASRSFGANSAPVSIASSTGLGHDVGIVKLGESGGAVGSGDGWSEQAAGSIAPATVALVKNALRMGVHLGIGPERTRGASSGPPPEPANTQNPSGTPFTQWPHCAL